MAVPGAAVVAGALFGFSWAWTVFFAVLLVRSLVLPLVGPMRKEGLRFTPKQLGIAEAVFSMALIVIAVSTS